MSSRAASTFKGDRRLLERRTVVGLAALGTVGSLTGCGGLSLFSSGRAKIPELPALSGGGALRTVWTSNVPGEVGFQPALAGSAVWAAAADGTVALIDARSGRSVWQVNAGRRLVAGVGSDGQIGVVAGRDGSLIALDSSGKQRWASSVGAEVVTVPGVGAGIVVVRASDNRVSAFDLGSGARRWSFQRQAPALVLRQTGGITIDRTQVYVGLPGGRMLALAADTGAQRWESAVAIPRGSNEIERIADLVGNPRLAGSDVCAAAFQGRVACLDVGTGRTLWSREISSAAGIDLDSRALVVTDEKGHIHAFSRSGSSLWRQEKLAGRGLSAPMIASTRLLLADSQGVVHLLSMDDGALLARIDLGKPLVGAPVRIDNIAVLQTRGGSLFGIAFE
jgi:outer membrane protein assembly factor BamB